MYRTARVLLGTLVALCLVPAPVQGASALQDVRTQAENSGFTQYTAYDSMMVYLGRIQAAGTEMRLGTFGRSHAGRDLPYAVFSRPAVTRPWEAWSLDRPIVVLAAGVHGGERTLRESLLVMVRELTTPGSYLNAFLDDLTILVVPQLNPDGFSIRPDPQRGNLRGVDLNRDYMKLEHPEIQGYVQNVLLPWAPHLFVDGHNGGSRPYNLNYQCPSHPAADLRITRLCDDDIFPTIDRKLEAAGYRSWYYRSGNETRWDVGASDPRIARNYGGLANMVAVLFESPGGQSMTDGVRSGRLAYEAVLEWSRDNADVLKRTVLEARREAIALGSGPGPFGEIPIEVDYEPEERSVEYLLEIGAEEASEIVHIQSDSLMKRPVATHTRPRPWAYLLPPEAESAVELLDRHAVEVEVLREPVELMVDAYTIGGLEYESIYDHEAATVLEVHETVTRSVSFPAGAFIVRTGQAQGRIAAMLLEAESRDGVVYWSRMDALIPVADVEAFQANGGEAPVLPIYKLMSPTPVPAAIR